MNTQDATIRQSRNANRPAAARTSQPLIFHVQRPDSGDSRLPAPAIDEASGNALDLGDFTGNPNATVDPWPLIAVGQTVWLRITGVLGNGGTDTITLLDGVPVTAAMISGVVWKAIPRSRLEALSDNSTITVECKVNFSGGAEAGAIAFPRKTYTLHQTVTDFEDFETAPLGYHTGGLTLPAFTITIDDGYKIYIGDYANNEFFSRPYLQVGGIGNWAYTTLTLDLRKDRKRIRFACQTHPAHKTTFEFRDAQGAYVGELAYAKEEPAWLEYTAPPGKSFRYVHIDKGHFLMDNVSLT